MNVFPAILKVTGYQIRKRKEYSILNFNELELDEQLIRATKEMGFETASPIQEKAIPAALS